MFTLYLQFTDGNDATYKNVTDFAIKSIENEEPMMMIVTNSFEVALQMDDISEFSYTYIR